MPTASDPPGVPPTPAAARTSPDSDPHAASQVASAPGEPRWHSRGYLPHVGQPGLIQAIAFRLHDSLPQSKLKQWERELVNFPEEERKQKLRAWIEKYLDAGHGSCWLRDLRIGSLVENAMLFFDSQRYNLLAWCVMPNHVHVLIETMAGWDLGKLLHSWKGYSAHEATKLLGRKGEFWQREYFDRFIRDGEHYENVLRYIENNPVKSGLVHIAEAWPLSSARWRRRAPSLPFA